MKKENWDKLVKFGTFHVSRLSKIGTKKDMIRTLKSLGDYDYIKKLNEDGEFNREFARIGNTYYAID